jgi:hypothetical protein
MAFFWFVIRSRECCYSMKFELLTNSTVVDGAIMFVVEKSKELPIINISAVISQQ